MSMNKTGIQWADYTWNPITGCTKVSPGCAYCYAEAVDKRFDHDNAYAPWIPGGRVPTLHYDRLDDPLGVKKGGRVFVCSMSDLFHEAVPLAFVYRVFQAMAEAPQHTFQVLTKRPERALEFFDEYRHGIIFEQDCAPWPLRNVWFGVTAENQRMVDERLPLLAQIPAAIRWLSAEPLLGPLDIEPWLERPGGLGWIVVGGESGPGPERRRLVFNVGRSIYSPKAGRWAWVKDLHDQCMAASVPFLFKQWGGPRSSSGGRTFLGQTWDQYPEAVSAIAERSPRGGDRGHSHALGSESTTTTLAMSKRALPRLEHGVKETMQAVRRIEGTSDWERDFLSRP